MRPLTFSTNKHLIPLANKPLLSYPLEAVKKAGVKEVLVNYNPGQLEELKDFLGDGKKWGMRITYVLQEKPLGLGSIINCCRPFLGKGKFFMHLGDNIFWGGIKSLVEYFSQSDLNGLVTVIHHPENWRMGVPFFDKKGRLVRYVEKPEKPPHDWAIPGLYFLDDKVFGCFEGKEAIKPSVRGEYEISAIYQWLLDHDFKVETKEFKGIWKDPGKFDDWLDTNQFLLDQEVKEEFLSKIGKDVQVKGRVKVGKNCRISRTSLRGPIIIGDGVVVKDSFIGPYSSIGDNCQIIKAKIENSILVKGVKVENIDMPLDSSLVGEESVIEGNGKGNLELFIGNKCQVRL